MKPWGQMTDDEKDTALDAAISGSSKISPEIAAWARATRAREQWERYDTICIGPGAREASKGWFNSWAEFANASQIVWFSGRDPNVGLAYTNQTTERTDFAQDLYQLMIEFIAPFGMADLAANPLDAQFFPMYFTKEGPNEIAFLMQLAQSDNVLQIPGAHAPAGTGTTGLVLDQSASPTVYAGNNGDANVSNTWKWPEPVMMPAQGSLQLTAQISNPMKQFLQQYATLPGNLNVPMEPPGPQGETNTLPLWYKIRITHRGPRYLQLRQARSAA
jgi:hypothetical protein